MWGMTLHVDGLRWQRGPLYFFNSLLGAHLISTTRRRRHIVNFPSGRLLLPILGAVLLMVQPAAAAQIGPQTATDPRPIPALGSQAIADRARSGIDPRISEAQDLFVDHQVMESLRLFEDIVDEYPELFEALWGAARSAIAQGLLSRGRETQNQWFRIGESYARRATEVEPETLEALYWLLSAKGLRAAQTGGRDAAALSREVYDLAHRVLEMDPLHAGAHHALGVVNYRVRRLSVIERWVASTFLGGDVIGLTSWEDAERYLTRAIELRPEYILFHLDLGRMYLSRKRNEEARIHFQRALELPLLVPPDTRFQQNAERLLAETLD